VGPLLIDPDQPNFQNAEERSGRGTEKEEEKEKEKGKGRVGGSEGDKRKSRGPCGLKERRMMLRHKRRWGRKMRGGKRMRGG